MPPQPPLPAEVEDRNVSDAAGDALLLVAERGLFGLVWLDEALTAYRRFGALADFVVLGAAITDTLLPLIGLEEEILALPREAAAPFEMPNVSMVDSAGATPRMNLHVYRLQASKGFLLVISKVLGTGELEIGIAQQVRARMIAEAEIASQARELAALNAELSRANGDLSEFAYVISHDLKAPLRAMRIFAEDLEAAIDEGTGDPSRLAQKIKLQSRRMAQMLTDLHAYSKIGRQEDAIEMVDTAELAGSIVATMPRPPSMKIEITGDWPVVETMAAPLDLVLRNLIGNAIMHHNRDEGLVTVHCQHAATALQIEVADDGPGIDPGWHEAIFKPFRTVGPVENSERSGIGLALVRRAIETCGATIELNSNPSLTRGARFVVVWPRRGSATRA